MTKSRRPGAAHATLATGAALLLGVAAAPAFSAPAGTTEGETLVAGHRRLIRDGLRLDCPRGAEPDEIVVCGSREEQDRRHRLPLPVASAPRPADQAGGEQRAALAIDTSRCTTVGRHPQCTSGLDVIGIGFAIARAVARAITEDD